MENVIGGAGMPKKKKIQRKSIDKTKTIPKPKASIEELQESRNGGQIALRGYSYQFLCCHVKMRIQSLIWKVLKILTKL